jgi:hypothetical protein
MIMIFMLTDNVNAGRCYYTIYDTVSTDNLGITDRTKQSLRLKLQTQYIDRFLCTLTG